MERGICFSGGGIKCAAHIGAVKAFEEYNIKFDYISGTSSGSIIGSLYALGYSADEMLELLIKYSKKINYIEFRYIIKLILDLILFREVRIDGLNSGKKLEKIIDKLCRKKDIININEIDKKLIIPSVDLCNGKIYIFSSVKRNVENRNYIDKVVYDDKIKISEAVRASCSYPGVFCPFKYKNTKLIDGGIRENIPWKELKELGADEVWCVTFSKKLEKSCDKNLINVISSSINILCHELSIYETTGNEDMIDIEVDNIDLLDSSKIEYLYKKGYRETKKFIEKKMKNK